MAYARLILVAVAAAALYVDPSGSAELRIITWRFLALYAIYAVAALIAATRVDPIRMVRWRRISHIGDFLVIAALNFLTYGPNSPLFLFFVFLLFCSTARFDWRATVWTAAGTLLLYASMGFYYGFVLRHPEFELNRFIVRLVYVATLGAALVYLDAYRERLQQDVRGLAEWPRRVPMKLEAAARELLMHAAAELHVNRVLMIWRDNDDDAAYAALLRDGAFSLTDAHGDGTEMLAIPALTHRGFYAHGDRAIVAPPAGSDIPTLYHGRVFSEDFESAYPAHSVLSVEFSGETVRGRLFFLDGDFAGEDLVIADVVSALVASRLDQYQLIWRMRQTAKEEERTRVAVDLHDGVLQTLAATAMQLRLVGRAIERNPGEALTLVTESERAVQSAQRELRALFETDLLPGVPRASLTDQLDAVAAEYRARGMSVEIEGGEVTVPHDIRRHVKHLVREALANAETHASASRVVVELAVNDSALDVVVDNDGQSFPFHGRFDLDQLLEMETAPKTLTRRVASLGGRLTIESGKSGSRLAIELPLGSVA